MDITKLLGLPQLASVHGKDVDNLIVYVHYLMVILFVGWSSYFFYTLWRFRKSRNPKADYSGVTSHASNYLELAVAAIEVVLLVWFAVPLNLIDAGWNWLTTRIAALGVAPYEVIHQPTGSGDTGVV